jgi:hypothetical protein
MFSDTKNPDKNRGSRSSFLIGSASKSQSASSVKSGSGDQETRRNAANCFCNPNKQEDWHADFTGCLVTEDLPAGTKCWVNVRIRTSKRGEKFLSVVLKPLKEGK